MLLTNRAAARARQQRWLDALADCHLALRLYPQYLKALKRRGDLYQVRITLVACCLLLSSQRCRQALGLFAEAASDFEAVCTAAAKDAQDTLGPSARSAMGACTRSTRVGVRTSYLNHTTVDRKHPRHVLMASTFNLRARSNQKSCTRFCLCPLMQPAVKLRRYRMLRHLL